MTGDEGERGDEGDDSFLEPKKESKKAALRRQSQADKAGRRHCRPAPRGREKLESLGLEQSSARAILHFSPMVWLGQPAPMKIGVPRGR